MLCTPALKVPPGWLGQFEFATPTPGHNGCQFWTDDDGVDPANAGCHYPYSDELCTAPVNGLFGEACEDADVLIETNPAAGVCHMHKLGVGHPDRFSCDAYCKGSGFAGGACVSIPDHCGVGVHSAECACS
jgi:hypothetical protein